MRQNDSEGSNPETESTHIPPIEDVELSELQTREDDLDEFRKLEPREENYNPEKAQENTRSTLALMLISLFAATNMLMLISLFFLEYQMEDKTKDFVTIILTTQGTLVGTALGFYFGDRS